MPRAETVAPVSGNERLDSVDVVRGAAILGILLVNMDLFFFPLYMDYLGVTWFDDPVNNGVERALLGFAKGKFYTIFSILFGFGLAIQFERFRAGGLRFSDFWLRRMLVLLAFGLLHGLLIWFGDILVWYAIGGIALLPFRHAKPRTLKIWVVVLLIVPLALTIVLTLMIQLAGTVPMTADHLSQGFDEQIQAFEKALAEARDRYPQAGVVETLGLNVRQWFQVVSWLPLLLPNVVGMFVLGLLFARYRLFHDAVTYLPRIRAALVWLIPLALATNGACVLLDGRFNPAIPGGLSLLNMISMSVGQLAGCLTYIFLLLVAFHSARMRRFIAPLGAVGRMALTNYLTHSFVFTTLANGYGAGLYGRVSPFTGLVMTVAVFGIQIVVSNAWLRRFRFGPFEWLWRSLTYGKLQRFRVAN